MESENIALVRFDEKKLFGFGRTDYSISATES